MFISTLDLFKVGIGPSSSHTLGPMLAAKQFIDGLDVNTLPPSLRVRCYLKGSLAHTGKGHASDRAVLLGLHSYKASELVDENIDDLVNELALKETIDITSANTDTKSHSLLFSYANDIIFDKHETLAEHPNGMVFTVETGSAIIQSQTYFSIGGGFIASPEELQLLVAPIKTQNTKVGPYPFDSGTSMLEMAAKNDLSIAEMKRLNEIDYFGSSDTLTDGINTIWETMKKCIEAGLSTQGTLPGGLDVQRRAQLLLKAHETSSQHKSELSKLSDYLCAYAMAVNEENAAGHGVVTAPTNGAAGVIPAVLYYFIKHENGSREDIHDFLLTAAAIGGIIKHRSSISGAEVGCQGEVGSAAAMAAAGLCQVMGGTAQQVENAAEIALEHHLGMTCDPIGGLVQVPCIERNGFGAIKAYTAASLALSGSGEHLVSLDSCIAAMKQIGKEMSEKFKETSLGGLAVTITEC